MVQVSGLPWCVILFFGVSVEVRFGPERVRAFGNKLQVCAVVSLLTGKCVPPTTAMTGEVQTLPPFGCARRVHF